MSKAIEIENFSYRYPDGTVGLTNVSLSIEHGERVVLVGPNGAGKSTLLLAMAGFVKGTGRVLVDGLEINRKNTKQIRRLLGCCMENPDDQLFMPTLFEDAAFGPLNMGLDVDEAGSRAAAALEKVGLGGMGDKAPHHLSAGQKRAAAIATVLSMSPAIITFDEPDGNLDPRSQRNLVKLLLNLSQTLIVATCNMNFALSIADRAVLTDKGSIVADGDAGEIMSNLELMTNHGLEVPHAIR